VPVPDDPEVTVGGSLVGRPGFVARARHARAAGSSPRKRRGLKRLARRVTDFGEMQLDHERLDVYDLALQFLVLSSELVLSMLVAIRRIVTSETRH
jgi:hypothetical protein